MSGQRSAGYAPEQEVRFAVVLYGGVSLAIYINGVAQELLRMVRATADLPAGQELSGSELVYRELGQLLSDGGPNLKGGKVPTVKATDPIRTRFVVDIVSGSSAGGINGIALAKALALRLPSLDGLRDVWLDKADLDSLLNDHKSEPRKYPPHPQGRTLSLINSERMYGLVLETLMEMGKAAPKSNGQTSFADNIDLFVTATDLVGLQVPIQLAGGKIEERIHKHVFHFEYEAPEQAIPGTTPTNDFTDRFDPMLAFAARCTSSFPVAFEPMSLDRIEVQLKRLRPVPALSDLLKDYEKFFRPYTASGATFGNRLFADGGYLDNRPFSYASDVIQFRSSTRPVQRKLLFVDPFPAPPTLEEAGPREISFIENAMLAAMKLPRYEVIRGDIQVINAMNRQLNRLEALRDRFRNDIDRLNLRERMPESPADFAKRDLRAMVEGSKEAPGYGDKYPPYHHLRVYDVSDSLARILCRAAGFEEESDYFYFIRLLVKSWRDANFQTYVDEESTAAGKQKETENAFLDYYDVDYRARRLNHLRVKIDKCLKEEPGGKARDELHRLREVVELQLRRLRAAVRALESNGDGAPLSKTRVSDLRAVLERHYEVVMNVATRKGRYDEADEVYKAHRPALDTVMTNLQAHLGETFNLNSAELAFALEEAVSVEGGEIKDAYNCFHWHDALTLPFLQGTGAREYSDVAVYRVSPADGTLSPGKAPSEEKLAGTRAAAFGGFMERSWRENDMMWGRLDGAERIITALLPGADHADLRDHYISRVQDEILSEEFSMGGPAARDRIYHCLAHCLRRDGVTTATVDELVSRGDELLTRTPTLAHIIDKGDFRSFLKKWYCVPDSPANEDILDWSARGLRILSRMIDDLPRGGKGRVAQRISSTLRSTGLVLTGLLRLILPRSLSRDAALHLVRLAVLAGALVLGAGFFVFDRPDIGDAGVVILAVSLGAWLLLDVGTRLITGRLSFRRLALVALIVIVLPLTVLGAYEAWHYAEGFLNRFAALPLEPPVASLCTAECSIEGD